jgi:DNA repair protein RecO (recombination protein O)
VGGTIHQTKAIVLRTVLYGETSLIISAYTELFGLQSYLVQGVRKSSKKGGAANCFMPGALLELVVYYNEFRQLNRIREFKWSHLYHQLFSDVVKNSVLLYIIELIQKNIRQPEPNEDLFGFLEDALIHLDRATDEEIPNYPLFFSVHLSFFFGFQPVEKTGEDGAILDLQEGIFTNTTPLHPHYTEGAVTAAWKEFLKVRTPSELPELQLPYMVRKELLVVIEQFYVLHIAEFGKMKSTQILHEVLQ